MTKEEVLKAIQEGRYTITCEEECGCMLNWSIENGDLVLDIDSDFCWVGNILRIDDEVIAENILDGYPNYFVEDFSFEDIFHPLNFTDYDDDGICDCYEEFKYFDIYTENETHKKNVYTLLVKFIEENNYDCYVEFPRNFSNEYTCILARKGARRPDNARPLTPEQFADYYLEEDDAATKYYKGFDFVEKQQARSPEEFF